MSVLRFLSMQAATEDRTERAMFDAFLVADEFRVAIEEADSLALAESEHLARVCQIRERMAVAISELIDVENEIMRRQSAITKGRMH